MDPMAAIPHSSPSSPTVVALNGQGLAPVATITPSALSFGDVALHHTATLALSVGNTGDAPLEVTGITLDGDTQVFTVDTTPFTVAPGQTLGLVGAMVLYALLLRPIGFLAATTLLITGCAVVLGERKFHVLIPIAVVTAVVIWYLVQETLGIFLRPWPWFIEP